MRSTPRTGKVNPTKKAGSQAKKRTTSQRAVNSRESNPPADPLISPVLTNLSQAYKRKQVTTDEDGQTPSTWPLDKIPPQLLPFIKSPSLETLAGCLRQDKELYFHPLVRHQVLHLEVLRTDDAEWNRLGWDCELDEERSGFQLDPARVTDIARAMKSLIEAHARAMIPGLQIKWHTIMKTGKPSAEGLTNPYPRSKDPDIVPAHEVYRDWDELRRGIKTHLTEKLRTLPPSPTPEWIADLKDQITGILNENHIGGSSALQIPIPDEIVSAPSRSKPRKSRKGSPSL